MKFNADKIIHILKFKVKKKKQTQQCFFAGCFLNKISTVTILVSVSF